MQNNQVLWQRRTCYMFIYIYIYRKGVFLFALIYMYNLALVDLQLKKNKTDIIYIYIYLCVLWVRWKPFNHFHSYHVRIIILQLIFWSYHPMPGITSMSLTYSGQVYLKYMYLKSNHIKGIYIITFIKKVYK